MTLSIKDFANDPYVELIN